jgi:hypothetical protein
MDLPSTIVIQITEPKLLEDIGTSKIAYVESEYLEVMEVKRELSAIWP